MTKRFLLVLVVISCAFTARANNLDTGKQAVRALFPEVSGEQQLSVISTIKRYKFFIGMQYKRVVQRARKMYTTGQRFSSGIVISGFSHMKNGEIIFNLDDKAGNRVGSCRVTRYGDKAEILFSTAPRPVKALRYRVFRVRPRLHLFPLRH